MIEIDHNPLAPKQNDKLPFWKQPITLPLVLWVLLHIVLTAWLFSFMHDKMIGKGDMDPNSTQQFSLLAMGCFSIVVFCLATLRKLGELTLRPFRRRQ